MKIDVLWIDDDPKQSFIDSADNEGINIEVATNVDDGISMCLNGDKLFDAIILDANCISHNDGTTETDIIALSYALRRISEERIIIPWFVYSGGGFKGEQYINVQVSAYERFYDARLWYRKPADMDALFNKIKEVVNDSSNPWKQRYPDLFDWYPRPRELKDILEFMSEDKCFNSDVCIRIRKELEWLMDYFYDCGILSTPIEGSKLTDCARKLTNKSVLSKENIVPQYIQQYLQALCAITNDGSHQKGHAHLDIKNGDAPYLIRSLVMGFLNVLFWAKSLPRDEEGRNALKQKVQEVLRKDTESNRQRDNAIEQIKKEILYYQGVVERDNYGNYHCDLIALKGSDAAQYLGKTVRVKRVKENENPKTKEAYPYFGLKVIPYEIS